MAAVRWHLGFGMLFVMNGDKTYNLEGSGKLVLLHHVDEDLEFSYKFRSSEKDKALVMANEER